MKWTVGIITAPREQGYYLGKTVNSVQKAGWEPIIFAEPGSPVPDDFKGTIIRRRKTYGDWTNWATGLYELFLSEPDTDYFLMLEDDAIFSRCKEYLEYAIPKLEPFASLSFYTPSIYAKKVRGFHDESHGKCIWSTTTVVMSHESVRKFFSDEDVQKHRTHDIFKVNKDFWKKGSFGSGYTSIIDTVGNTVKDAVIGHWAEKANLPVYFHSPSLAEHIGFHSTLTDDVTTIENGRLSKDFVGENFDASIWIGQKVKPSKITI